LYHFPCLIYAFPDTELLISLHEDLAAAGIPRRRHDMQPFPAYHQNAHDESYYPQEDVDMQDVDMQDMDMGDQEMQDVDEQMEEPVPMQKSSKNNYPISPRFTRDGYEDDDSPDLQDDDSPPRAPLMKVSQRIDDSELHRNSTDGSDEDERFGFGAAIVPPTPLMSQSRGARPVSPDLEPQKRTLGRYSLGFGNDTLLAEQVCC
jgi:hypothetical protein